MTRRDEIISIVGLIIVWFICVGLFFLLAPRKQIDYTLICKQTSTGSEVCHYVEK